MSPEKLASLSREDKESLLIITRARLKNMRESLQAKRTRSEWETAARMSNAIAEMKMTIRQLEESLK